MRLTMRPGLAALDSNQDGKIDYDEFVSMHKKRFDELDANKDGSIDEAERTAAEKIMEEQAKNMREQMRKRMESARGGRGGDERAHGPGRRPHPDRPAPGKRGGKPDGKKPDRKATGATEAAGDAAADDDTAELPAPVQGQRAPGKFDAEIAALFS
jgi:hypothetical protein